MTENIKAYAKINLHLDVTAKRTDGYHDVQTVMQTVSLFDNVSVTPIEKCKFICECNAEGVPNDERNIAVKAAMLFSKTAGINEGVHINIDKQIPVSAGLAGGSTDAAAVLVALNRIYDSVFTYDELCKIASKLGADVPFCIAGGCSYSDGRGDLLHEFPDIPQDTVFVIGCGNEGVSTPWAYSLLDSFFDDFKDYEPRGIQSLKEVLLSNSPELFYKNIFNIFESPVVAQRKQAEKIKKLMEEKGALGNMMSGSGPSVFGVFKNAADAQAAVISIKENGLFAATCYPVAKRNI